LNNQKSTAEPFQEGFASEAGDQTHVFTDYRWNDGTVMRHWLVDPSHVDPQKVVLRPFSLSDFDKPDQ
jgi:hypothetical protein